MKVLFRILKILAVLIIVITITLFFASFVMQDTVASIVLRSLNKNISTKYEFKSVRLSYLRKFPKASLELKNVLVHSSKSLDRSCFSDLNTDTLLSAESVVIEFSLTDVLKGIYDIDRVSVRKGRLNLFTDTAGNVNYDIYIENRKDTTSGSFLLDLERINAYGITVTYNNVATKLLIMGIIEDGRMKSRITDNNINFSADAEIGLDVFRLFDFSISQSIPSEVDVDLFYSGKGFLFDKSTIKLDKHLFTLSGSVSSDNVLDLALAGEDIDISFIKKFLPDKVREKISGYNPSGVMDIKSTFKGLLSRTANPGIKIDFDIQNGNVTYGSSVMNIKDLSLNGSFSNGSAMSPATSSLSIKDFKGTLGSSQYTGSLLLSDFDNVFGKLELKGTVNPAEIREFFNLTSISSTSGSIDLDLTMEGIIPHKEKYSLSDFFSLNPDADMKFNSFSIEIPGNRILVNDVDGRLKLSDTLIADNLRFTSRDHKFMLSGLFINFPGWITGKPVILKGTADLSCNKLLPEVLFPTPASSDTTQDREEAVHFPGDVILDAGIKIDNFVYKTFKADNITGRFSYKPKILNFKSLNLNSLDGSISGNGFVVQNTDKSFIGRGSFVVNKVNVNKAFISFKNFDQGFIKAENLSGSISGTLSLLLPMDSLLNPSYKSVAAEGKFVITEGELIDFGPVKELSSFISISELQNIHFEKLENDFFIRNNFFYLPQMDVKSSAADLSVNGKHSLNNDYEYHVKILLSEALSRKIRKPKPNTTEFGAVQDDGLGRTSLLLKITGNDEDVKVGYDMKAAGNQFKS